MIMLDKLQCIQICPLIVIGYTTHVGYKYILLYVFEYKSHFLYQNITQKVRCDLYTNT